LIALGALTKTGDVTKIGRQMEQYPVESSYARMLIQAQSCSAEVQSKLAVIIGIQEIGGIVKNGPRYTGWRKYTNQTQSDLLAHYDIFIALSSINPDDYEELGILSKNVNKAREVMQRLNHDLKDIQIDDDRLTPITPEEQEQLLRCIVAGQIDQLWTVAEDGTATHITTNAVRQLSSGTVVRDPKLVAGIPFDLQVPTHGGTLQTLHLVQSITAVNTNWLVDLAPETFMAKRGRMFYDPRSGTLVARQQVRLGGQVLEGSGIPLTENTKENQRAFRDAFATWTFDQLERERRTLGKFHTKRIPAIPLPQIQQQVRALAGDIVKLGQLPNTQRLAMTELSKLHTHLGNNFMAQLGTTYKQERQPGRHHAHRGWLPPHKRK
jgi:HrpA-like RNA helicase